MIFGQVDSLFFNTWLRAKDEMLVLKKIATEKNITFGQL
jgi:hypothetical protein